MGKLSRFLLAQGHQVQVLTTAAVAADQSLKHEIPETFVRRTDWIDIDKVIHPFTARRVRRMPGSDNADDGRNPASGRRSRLAAGSAAFRRHVAAVYNGLLFVPDRYAGWIPWVAREGRKIVERCPPDLIYASGPPFSGFVGARLLSRRTGIPWVAEFRDPWADEPYYRPPGWRAAIDRWLEARTLASASALVTISKPWAQHYRDKFCKPVHVAMNGFDPVDFPLDRPRRPRPDRRLRILHAGTIYPERRDPTPLFRALAGSGLTPEDVVVSFYGSGAEFVRQCAVRCGALDFVETFPAVAYSDGLALQRDADVLLLLQWNDPKEVGNIPAKLFEYLASRRPVLGIGYEAGVVAALLQDRQVGVFSADLEVISQAVQDWYRQKQAGGIPDLPPSVRDGLTRDEQYAGLAEFLDDTMRRIRDLR